MSTKQAAEAGDEANREIEKLRADLEQALSDAAKEKEEKEAALSNLGEAQTKAASDRDLSEDELAK